jgi:hypothetical protein
VFKGVLVPLVARSLANPVCKFLVKG